MFGVDGKWIVALCFGACVVAMYSWARFDEPSCDGQSEFFTRYKPRFSTSSKSYWRAKWGYIGAIAALFFCVSLVPEIFTALAGADATAAQAKLGETWVPLATALGLITLENIPLLKDIERKLRGFLHAFARIPDGIRRTVAQMKSSPFNFTSRAIACLTRKLGLEPSANNQPPSNLSTLLIEDDLLHTWYNVGALLSALSERNRDRTGIEPLFFESYKDELDSIADRHTALADVVRQHLAELQPGNIIDSSLPREMRELRDRLYTFIACAVHSSVKAEGESLEILKKLGFAIRPKNENKASFIAQLAGLGFVALNVVTALSGQATLQFREGVVLPLVDPAWVSIFPMPKEILGFYAWSWTTAIFYFAAIMGALAVRNSRVAKREWFDITNLKREAPVLRYITPTLVGTALGCLALFAIALLQGPAFKTSFGDLGKSVPHVMCQLVPWFPLATVMAFVSVALSDRPIREAGFWRAAIIRAAYGAAGMAVVGFLTSELSISSAICTARQTLGQPSGDVISVGHLLSVFITAQIGLFSFILCLIAQVAERYITKTRCFAGKCVEIVTRHGGEFRIYFDPSGAASLLSCAQRDAKAGSLQCRGQWQFFPEGTAVKWNLPEGESWKAGEFGLISWYGESLIYEGYAEGLTRTADFVGQVHVRPSTESSMNILAETARASVKMALPAPTGPKLPECTLAACEGALA